MPKKCFVYKTGVEEFPEVHYFMHRGILGESWVMTEKTTGLGLSVCEPTMGKAKEKINQIFNEVDTKEMIRLIQSNEKVPNDGKFYITARK